MLKSIYNWNLHSDKVLWFCLDLGWKLCTCLTHLLFPHWCCCWHVVVHVNQQSLLSPMMVQWVGYLCQIMWFTICCGISARWGQGCIFIIQYSEFELTDHDCNNVVITLRGMLPRLEKSPFMIHDSTSTQLPTTGASVLLLLTSTFYGSQSISCKSAGSDLCLF